MDIVRIKLLKSNSFWFLNDLHLGPGNSVSEPFDLNAANPKTKEKIIKASKEFGIISIVRQSKGTKPIFDINKDSTARFELPKTGLNRSVDVARSQEATTVNTPPPVPNAQEEMPDLKSFTEDNVPDPEPEIKETVPSEQDFEDAKTLLGRNGNTIKKVLRSLNKPKQETRQFLLACLEVEKTGKDRLGTIRTLEKAFLEVS